MHQTASATEPPGRPAGVSAEAPRYLSWRLSYGVGLGRLRSTHKVINQKLRRAKVMRGEEFPVGRGVGESDLVFAQVGAVYEVVPVREKQKHQRVSTCFFAVDATRFSGGRGGCVTH